MITRNIRSLFIVPIFVLLSLSGCQTTDVIEGAELASDQPDVTKYSDGWFYSYPFAYSDLDKTELAFRDPSVVVFIEYEDGCLYFNDGHQRTTPLLPYGHAIWNDEKKVLNYFGSDYHIGYNIESPGYILTPSQKHEFKNKQGQFNSRTGFVTTPRSECDTGQITYLFSLPPGVIDPTPFL
ncbi:hypothetical protein ES754_00825 [Psychrobacter frigidicola]|uniref:WG repeat-containing protein n=1 Tax=Psychrobacter frigidicola TaxID=45611 RepID=A0A5C7A9W3_9GAMM|nr:hypothetical protein [Psychrobacter frigidicola]TXD97563.1 hypothetical protein ES754_00825 [Psychrobacter frigidicola]